MSWPVVMVGLVALAGLVNRGRQIQWLRDRLEYSDSATLLGYDNSPPPAVVVNLDWLAPRARWVEAFLQDRLDPGTHTTSGYRAPETNAAVGGAANSAHVSGLGLDVGNGWDLATSKQAATLLEPHRQRLHIRQLYPEGDHLHIGFEGPR